MGRGLRRSFGGEKREVSRRQSYLRKGREDVSWGKLVASEDTAESGKSKHQSDSEGGIEKRAGNISGYKLFTPSEERQVYIVWTKQRIEDKEEGIKYLNILLKNVISSHENPIAYVTRNDIDVGVFDVNLTREEAESLGGVEGVLGMICRYRVTTGNWIFLA